MPGDYENNHPIIGTFLTITTLSFGIPAMYVMLRDRRIFDFSVSFILFVSSIMYHLSESWHTNSLFLTELEWHQLDNIGVMSVISSTLIYLSDFDSRMTSGLLNWLSFYVILCCQIKDPWNMEMTVYPVVAASFIPIFRYSYKYYQVRLMAKGASVATSSSSSSSSPSKSKKKSTTTKKQTAATSGASEDQTHNPHHRIFHLNWWTLFLGFFFLIGCGGPCFYLGLDDSNDPGRVFHFIWHAFASTGSYYLSISVIPNDKKKLLKTPGEGGPYSASLSRSVSIER